MTITSAALFSVAGLFLVILVRTPPDEPAPLGTIAFFLVLLGALVSVTDT